MARSAKGKVCLRPEKQTLFLAIPLAEEKSEKLRLKTDRSPH
jgi:hypothetical protein